MTVNERIKYLRKDILHMTQEEFAPRIRVSRSNLGGIETDRVGATRRLVEDICSEFSINHDWLMTGNGGDENIFIKTTRSEKAYNRFGYIMENSTPSKKAALSMLLDLLYSVPDEKWDYIMSQYKNIESEIKEEEG